MKHEDLPHVQKFVDNEAKIADVITLLEDMRDECGSNGVRNAAILARDTLRCLVTITQIIEVLKNKERT